MVYLQFDIVSIDVDGNSTIEVAVARTGGVHNGAFSTADLSLDNVLSLKQVSLVPHVISIQYASQLLTE